MHFSIMPSYLRLWWFSTEKSTKQLQWKVHCKCNFPRRIHNRSEVYNFITWIAYINYSVHDITVDKNHIRYSRGTEIHSELDTNDKKYKYISLCKDGFYIPPPPPLQKANFLGKYWQSGRLNFVYRICRIVYCICTLQPI